MPSTRFEHEKLEVDQLQLRFISWLAELCEEMHVQKSRRLAETPVQLGRASLSVLLNVFEGNASLDVEVPSTGRSSVGEDEEHYA